MYKNAYILLHVEMSHFLLKTWGKIAPQVRHLEVRNRSQATRIEIRYFCCNIFLNKKHSDQVVHVFQLVFKIYDLIKSVFRLL